MTVLSSWGTIICLAGIAAIVTWMNLHLKGGKSNDNADD